MKFYDHKLWIGFEKEESAEYQIVNGGVFVDRKQKASIFPNMPEVAYVTRYQLPIFIEKAETISYENMVKTFPDIKLNTFFNDGFLFIVKPVVFEPNPAK